MKNQNFRALRAPKNSSSCRELARFAHKKARFTHVRRRPTMLHVVVRCRQTTSDYTNRLLATFCCGSLLYDKNWRFQKMTKPIIFYLSLFSYRFCFVCLGLVCQVPTLCNRVGIFLSYSSSNSSKLLIISYPSKNVPSRSSIKKFNS